MKEVLLKKNLDLPRKEDTFIFLLKKSPDLSASPQFNGIAFSSLICVELKTVYVELVRHTT